jgi:hypothetical protein
VSYGMMLSFSHGHMGRYLSRGMLTNGQLAATEENKKIKNKKTSGGTLVSHVAIRNKYIRRCFPHFFSTAQVSVRKREGKKRKNGRRRKERKRGEKRRERRKEKKEKEKKREKKEEERKERKGKEK